MLCQLKTFHFPNIPNPPHYFIFFLPFPCFFQLPSYFFSSETKLQKLPHIQFSSPEVPFLALHHRVLIVFAWLYGFLVLALGLLERCRRAMKEQLMMMMNQSFYPIYLRNLLMRDSSVYSFSIRIPPQLSNSRPTTGSPCSPSNRAE